MIISAASAEFGPSLLALLGSINLNWPNHPDVLIYDIGLDHNTIDFLESNGIVVKKVPPFCPHWRSHFTWKIWCLNDAPCQNVLWMDAGLVVLQPLDEILDAVGNQGYFLTTNYELLDWEASEAACSGCGVSPDFRYGKLTLPGTMMGFRKGGRILQILEEALSAAFVERHIAATEVSHRHDQAIISLLVYKHLGQVVIADGTVYLGSLSPRQMPGQKVWVHRRKILDADVKHLAAHVRTPGDPFIPAAPYPLKRATSLSHLYRVYWWYGRGNLSEARDNLEMAFRIDSTLKNDITLLASKFTWYQRRLQGFLKTGFPERDFIAWAVEQLRSINGSLFAFRLVSFLNREKHSEHSNSDRSKPQR